MLTEFVYEKMLGKVNAERLKKTTVIDLSIKY